MTTRDFSTRPAGRSGLQDLVLVALAAAGLVAAAAATVATRRDLAEAVRAVEEARRDPAARRAPLRRDSLQGLAAQALATSEASPARILADLAALMPADVRLNGATLTYRDGVAVELTVMAREGASYDRFLERLAASSRFTDILPGAESRGGVITSPIRMRYRPGEAP
jgi:hypothetical protein